MAIKDYAHKQTDKELEELEKRIAQVYEDAADEMKVTVDEYFDSYSKRYEAYKKELDAGNITKEEFQQWELNQIGRGERYEAMRDALAERFVNADEVAMAYVNDATPSIYSLNRNYSNYAINQYDPDLDFSLWDESTVRNLIVNQPDLMPYYPKAKAVKRGIDLDYGKSQITKAVTSGILQGKSLTRIANDLMNRIEGMSRASALRSARTAITAAENAGRQDSFDEAADMGLKMEKVWLSTLDSRTRVAHQKADMQVVKYDKTFDVGGEALMFPGDNTHGASGWNLYNCRCTMFEKPEGMSMDDFDRWARDPETGNKEKVTGKSYEEWMDEKQEELERALAETEGEVNAEQQETLRNTEESNIIDYRRFASGEEADDYFRLNGQADWQDSLTDQEIGGIRHYTGSGYGPMNDLLRNGKINGIDDAEYINGLKDDINGVSSAIEKAELKDGIVVYRGCSDPKLAKTYKEMPYQDDGIISTSIDRSVSLNNFRGDYLLEIEVPPGKGIGAWAADISRYGLSESEFIMQRSSCFVETDQPREIIHNSYRNVTLIHMKYIGNKMKELE